MLWDLISAITSGSKYLLITTLISVILAVPVVLFSLAFHEAAHAFAANQLGDPTARRMGRLTLNPVKHLDLMGTICMMVFGFGWAKPVPINARNFKNPKRGMAISAIAGPISNLFLSLFSVISLQIVLRLVPTVCQIPVWAWNPVFYAGMPFSHMIMTILFSFFYTMAYLNAALAIFNLLPIPPFDGSRLAFVFLPDRLYWGIMKYERIIMMVLLVGLATGFISVPFQLAAEGITEFFFNATRFIGGW